MSRSKFWCLACLDNIDPTNFGGRDYLISSFQRQGIRNKDRSTPINTVSEQLTKENKWQQRKLKLDMDQFISTRKVVLKNTSLKHLPKVDDDALQLGGTLARQLRRVKPHCPKPVTSSGVACQLCLWDSVQKVIEHIQTCILCNSNPCVKQFAIFCPNRILVEEQKKSLLK